MTISVNVFDKAEIKEDQKTEFKTSIFVDPETQRPGFRQMMTIAETLAAFMNAEGGHLYVGIADNKDVRGIEDDLAVLANQANAVALHSPRGNDENYTYGGTTDKYELKIRAIVKACLSANASDYLGAVNFAKMGEKQVCRIEAKPCRPDDFVYAYCKRGPSKSEVAEIFKRFGNQKRKLEGAERDEFVRERTKEQVLANVNAVVSQNPAGLVEQVLAAINSAFATRPQVVGETVVVQGAVSLADPNFEALTSPKGFVFDGQHVCDVKGWREAYLALLDKLNELDAAKFDTLPTDGYFRKFFVDPLPRARLSGYSSAPHKYGTNGKIRAKELGGKAYFANPDYAVQRLLALFGVDKARVALRG